VDDSSGGERHSSTLRRYLADPCLVEIEGRFWLYPTTDGFPEWSSSSFRAYSSDNLVDWQDHGTVLELGTDVAWATTRAWAPAVIAHRGRYYLYFSADRNIGVAVGETPAGPFRDLGRPLVPADAYPGQMIDPAVFVDLDGTPFLYWGNGTAYGVQLNADMTSFNSRDVVCWHPGEFCEAAWVHSEDGVYYLTWSEGDTRSEDYRLAYATGSSALGPWRERGRLLGKRPELGIFATGHHSIAQDPVTCEWYIAYHRFALNGGDGFHREVVIDRLHHGPLSTLTTTPTLRGVGRSPEIAGLIGLIGPLGTGVITPGAAPG
jgi:beta-xylosidase